MKQTLYHNMSQNNQQQKLVEEKLVLKCLVKCGVDFTLMFPHTQIVRVFTDMMDPALPHLNVSTWHKTWSKNPYS